MSSPTATTSVIREDLRRLGLSYDLFTRTTTGTTTTSCGTCSGRCTSKGYLIERTTLGAFSASTGQHAARPLHRGHVPDLRLPGGARRPVRQLRQPARPDRPDRARARRSTASRPSSARRRTSSSTCRRSPSASREWIGGAGALAAERAATSRSSSLDELKPAADHPRPRLGRPRSRSTGYEERRRQADLRLVRRGHRLPVGARRVGARTAATPDAWREWWQNPDARHYYFMGKDNIVFHTRHLAERAARLRHGRRARRRARRRSSCRTTSSRASS